MWCVVGVVCGGRGADRVCNARHPTRRANLHAKDKDSEEFEQEKERSQARLARLEKQCDSQKQIFDETMLSIECPVCFETFDDEKHTPMALDCRHNICRECATQAVKRLKKKEDFVCITCNGTSKLCVGGHSVGKVNWTLKDVAMTLKKRASLDPAAS